MNITAAEHEKNSCKPYLVHCTAKDLLDPARGLIEDGAARLILKDPPYIISRKTGFNKKNADGNYGGIQSYAINTEFGPWDEKEGFTIDMLREAIDGMPRILKPGGAAIIFFDGWKLSTLKSLMEKAGFMGIRIIEWRKTNAVPINSRTNYLTNGREFALYGHIKGDPVLNNPNPLGVYRTPIYSGPKWDRFHTTQKSVKLFEDLISEYSNEGDLVVDPFSGSATTGVSSFRKKRRFIGSEPSDEYFNLSSSRIDIHYGEKAAPGK